MGFDEVQFPPDIAYGAKGGPVFATSIVRSSAGYEQRNSQWAVPLCQYEVGHAVKNAAQVEALIAFYRARQGRARGFRFKDWSDYRVTEKRIGTGNGSQTQFQLLKHYPSGEQLQQRIIAKPVASSVRVTVNGAVHSGVTVDATTGIITLATAPANSAVILADFEFDVPVRFDSDRMQLSLDGVGSSSWQRITLTELRMDEAGS